MPATGVCPRLLVIRCADDGVVNPEDPDAPTTAPFYITVWSGADAGTSLGLQVGEGHPACSELCEYPEEAWLDVVLSEPVDLTDDALFGRGGRSCDSLHG